MRSIFKVFNLGMLLAAVLAAGATASFAQDVCDNTDAQTKLQDTIRNSYQKDKPTAITAGKELLEKYGSCAFSADFVAWLKPLVPKWETAVKEAENQKVLSEILKRYDAAISSKNYDQAYAAGEELVAKFPDRAGNLNQILPLGLIGLYQSYPPTKNYKWNDQSLKWAKVAIDRLKSGEKPTKDNGKYGVFEFEMSKDDALSELTFAQAYINYWAKGDKQAGLPYYFEVLKMPGRHKNDPYGYATIGGYYQDEIAKLAKNYEELVKTEAPNSADTPEVAAAKEAKLKTAEGLLKAYLDRAIDALSRAWKEAPATDKNKDVWYKTVTDLYKLRFNKTDGLDAYIASTVAAPMPDPKSEVKPVMDADKAPSPSAANPASSTAAPASDAAAKSSPAAKPTASTPAKTPAKKVGNRK